MYVSMPQYWPEVLKGLTFFEAAFTPLRKRSGSVIAFNIFRDISKNTPLNL